VAQPSPFETLLYEKRGGVAYVTLNRPAQLNALNAQAIADLGAAFRDVRDDAAIHGAILTGAGERAFIAGADINAFVDTTPLSAADAVGAGHDTLGLIESLGKPVIAAVNGLALGGGCEVAMACSLRLASETAMFGQPEVKLGLIPGYGGTQRLPRLVGKGVALHLILTGETITAAEALRIGLVNEVLAPAELLPRAEALLAQIARNGPVAVGLALRAVHHGAEMSQAEGLQLEAALFALCASTEDLKEGARAFLEKRKPTFAGR
jgi:enoyl-CoA hydratase